MVCQAYTGAGVSVDREASTQGLFYAMYYGTGSWVRGSAGGQSSFQQEGLRVVTNMTDNTYKPVLLWAISEVRVRKPI